mmetsp:Transcript_61097/g.120298  ORF Transcript_61097/g.120298 Transcript_61097/m.120298 type:complete len:216 (+) Transcript_61097:1167-1814(+)
MHLRIVHPIRDHHYVCASGVRGDVGQTHDLGRTHPNSLALPGIHAAYTVAGDLPEATLAEGTLELRRGAILLRVVGEAPAGPTDHADPRGLQVLELPRVVATGSSLRGAPVVGLREVDLRHGIAESDQHRMHLVRPSLPDHIARADGIQANLSMGWDASAVLLYLQVVAASRRWRGTRRGRSARRRAAMESVRMQPSLELLECRCWGQALVHVPL